MKRNRVKARNSKYCHIVLDLQILPSPPNFGENESRMSWTFSLLSNLVICRLKLSKLPWEKWSRDPQKFNPNHILENSSKVRRANRLTIIYGNAGMIANQRIYWISRNYSDVKSPGRVAPLSSRLNSHQPSMLSLSLSIPAYSASTPTIPTCL